MFKLKVLLMAAEGAIAMMKKVVYMFSLNFTIFFFKDGFRNVQHIRGGLKNRAETGFYVT